MPTLLQINSVANIGSTGRIAEQIGQKAIDMGWKSYIAYGRTAAISKSNLIKIGSAFDNYAHAIGSKLLDCHGILSRSSTYHFIKQIDNIKPDVVQLHNLHGYYISYPILFEYLSKKNIPTVATMHDFWLMTGHCAYINDSCNKWRIGCGNCPRLKSYPASFLDRSHHNWEEKSRWLNSMKNMTIVPVSYWLDSKVKQSFLNGIKRNVIQNGIDLTQFYPEPSNIGSVSDNVLSILCVATRWTENNGFDDILKMARGLRHNAHVTIVGIDAKQKKLLPPNTAGIERTENLSELRKLYSNADVFVNPNKEVTFGLVTAEAMACGTPSIIYSGTAGEEIIGDLGYIVKNVSELINLINHMNKKSSEISRKCTKHISANFDYNTTLDNYISLYNNISNLTAHGS